MGIREPVEQLFVTTNIIVQATPTPIGPALDISAYVQTFFLCNPSFNANSVFWGDNQVTASAAGSIGTGIELLTGTSQKFVIRQERQLYEVQDPAILIAQKELCKALDPTLIPVVVWNPQNIFVIAAAAAAPVTISACFFRSVYI